MIQRIITAVLLIPVLLISIFTPGPPDTGLHALLFFILVIIAISVSSYEYITMMQRKVKNLSPLIMILINLALVTFIYILSKQTARQESAIIGFFPFILGSLAAMAFFSWEVFANHLRLEKHPYFIYMEGMLYLGFFLGHVLFLRSLPDGIFYIIFLLTAIWLGDSAGYFFGELMGKKPLGIPASPNKTVEGSIAHIIFSVIGAVLINFLFCNGPVFKLGFIQFEFQASVFPWHSAVFLGILMSISGQTGDLFESAIKRAVGVKDSGTILPGHGGMLDRIDSIVFAAPLFCYTIYILRWIQFG